MSECVCGHAKKHHFGHPYKEKEVEPTHCSQEDCGCNKYRIKTCTDKMVKELVEIMNVNPKTAGVAHSGDRIYVLLHKRNHPYQFPMTYKGVPVSVKYIGKPKLLQKEPEPPEHYRGINI